MKLFLTNMKKNNLLPPDRIIELLDILHDRFDKNMHRHADIKWPEVQIKLEKLPEKLWSLNEMEETEGEPDVLDFNHATNEFIFMDCSAESPKGRRSLCYDRNAWESRKEFKPQSDAMSVAVELGIEILSEQQYRQLQSTGKFDTKTSSWILTPESIRKLGGAIFGDWRYGQVFIYHNGAESYYAARGFRGLLRV